MPKCSKHATDKLLEGFSEPDIGKFPLFFVSLSARAERKILTLFLVLSEKLEADAKF